MPVVISEQTVDLLAIPRFRSEDLGLPMPDSAHAVSACLPTWADNVAYEEGVTDVINRLQAAYPRFCLHPQVRQLCQRVCGEHSNSGLVFPSRRVAERAAQHVVDRGGQPASLNAVVGSPLFGVSVTADDFSRLREYWQHAGEVVSSRTAEDLLAGREVTFTETAARTSVRRRIARLQGVAEGDVFLQASGMAAIACAWRAVRSLNPAGPTVQFGFPYVDTLKIQQRFRSAEYEFYPTGNAADLDALESCLANQRIAAIFCETPTNPLLTCPDLPRLRQLADRHGFLIVVDDTLGACLNLDVLRYADLVVTSLTKFFSGYGDVLAGSLVLNPTGRFYSQLYAAITSNFEELLSDRDTEVLFQNSNDLEARVTTINQNALLLAERLSAHPAVDRVYYPGISREPSYEVLQRPGSGYGGLMSIVLKQPEVTTARVFDALQVCKGPNLGTYFTLCCPYTILAHYGELEFVESCGVSRWLLRISVGVEPGEELWRRFELALSLA